MNFSTTAAASHWKWIVPLCIVGVLIWGPFGLILGALGPVIGKLVSKRDAADTATNEPDSGAFTAAAFEVLEQQGSVYSSTRVTGGSGFVTSSHTGAVYGHVDPVKSSTTIHRESQMWLRNIDTGQEANVTLPGDVAARPGHHLVFVWTHPEGKTERVANLNTNTAHFVGDLKASEVDSVPAKVFFAAVHAAIFAIPFLNILYVLESIWTRLIKRYELTTYNKKPNVLGVRTYGTIVLAMALLVLFSLASLSGPGHFHGTKFWTLYSVFTGVVFFAALHQLLRERRSALAMTEAVDRYMNRYINEVRARLATRSPAAADR